MPKIKQILLITVVIILALMVLPSPVNFKLGVTSSGANSTSIFTHHFYGGKLSTTPKIAIITPKTGWMMRGFQRDVAKRLQHELSRIYIVYGDIHYPGPSSSPVSTTPEVRVFRDEKDAAAFGAGCYVYVIPKEWRCWPIPFVRQWNSKVDIVGGPLGMKRNVIDVPDKLNGKGLAYAFSYNIENTGRFYGICSYGNPISEMSEEVAQSVSSYLHDSLGEAVKEIDEEMGKVESTKHTETHR